MHQKISRLLLNKAITPQDVEGLTFDQLIENTHCLSFLMTILYRKSKDLPDVLAEGIDCDVLDYAKEASGWDVPGGEYFKKPYNEWLNRAAFKKHWMFFLHQGVYTKNGVFWTGVLSDHIDSYYDRERPARYDSRYDHILDQPCSPLKAGFSGASGCSSKLSFNVQVDLFNNLTMLQANQSRIISSYIGEVGGFIHPGIWAAIVRKGVAETCNFHKLNMRDYLPKALLATVKECMVPRSSPNLTGFPRLDA